SALLAVELAFFLAATLSAVAAGLVVAGDLGWHVERRDGRVAFTALGALVVGAPLGYALAYLEYRLAGKAPMFRLDLRRSLWLTKSGVQRWDSRES
ncbi:MAG TPA: hypothetical protein VNA65_09225, partial [Candidatus Dormibacteraeota bacterium]|nr:hypothetical protein [Candidatus Dormibacteraeota bacterium]